MKNKIHSVCIVFFRVSISIQVSRNCKIRLYNFTMQRLAKLISLANDVTLGGTVAGEQLIQLQYYWEV